MPDDPNLELLAIIHGVQSAVQDVQTTLNAAIRNSTEEYIIIPITAASAISALINVQTNLLTRLTEQNQEIVENINDLVESLEKK